MSIFHPFRLVSTCPFRAWARNRVGFRKSGLGPLPGRPRPRGHFPKAPKAPWALQGGWAPPWGVLFQRNCMLVSLNRGEMCISSLVWLRLGGPGRPDRSWWRWRSMGSRVSYLSHHGWPLRSQVTMGGLNGLCVVVQYTPHNYACGPVSADAECAANECLRATRR